MNRSVRCAILSVSIVVAACTAEAPAEQPQANAPADIQSIETLRIAFASAYTAGDAEAVGRLYTEDAISQTNMQPSATGRAAIVEQLKANFARFKMRVDLAPDETHTLGRAGWERGRYTMRMIPRAGGDPLSMEGRYMIVLEKTADGWRVTRDMDNLIAPPPAPK